MEKTSLSSAGGVLAAFAASLCCIGPVAVAFLGIGSIGAFALLEPFRPHLIGVTVLLLGLAFYLVYRKREVACADGACVVRDGGKWNKMSVWGATVLAAFAIAFPYLGITPSASYSQPSREGVPDLQEEVTFLKVPLVCNAAPDLGCGSRAKFIMLDLMKEDVVKEAWLNRKGTAMAVVWNTAIDAAPRADVVHTVFSRHDLPVEKASSGDRADLEVTFANRRGWYRGSDVDALSIEEAGVIADRILTEVSRSHQFKDKAERSALREELKGIFQRLFLSLTSFSELDDATYSRINREVIAAGEKYVGKGNMPGLYEIEEDCEPAADGAACCAAEDHVTSAKKERKKP